MKEKYIFEIPPKDVLQKIGALGILKIDNNPGMVSKNWQSFSFSVDLMMMLMREKTKTKAALLICLDNHELPGEICAVFGQEYIPGLSIVLPTSNIKEVITIVGEGIESQYVITQGTGTKN